MICFKCRALNGERRHSQAMKGDWYETAYDPGRTIFLCVECYVPDSLAGRRTAAAWEIEEQIWGESEIEADESWIYWNAWDNGIRAMEESG